MVMAACPCQASELRHQECTREEGESEPHEGKQETHGAPVAPRVGMAPCVLACSGRRAGREEGCSRCRSEQELATPEPWKWPRNVNCPSY